MQYHKFDTNLHFTIYIEKVNADASKQAVKMWRKYPLKTAKKSAFVTKFSLKMSVKRFALPGAFLGSENIDKQAETLDFKPKMDISNRTEKRKLPRF